jgi:hypothetical protein
MRTSISGMSPGMSHSNYHELNYSLNELKKQYATPINECFVLISNIKH